jgi:Recombination directionality factor-like
MRVADLLGTNQKFGSKRPPSVAGRIRPGIRRLTAKGRDNPRAVKAYRDALQAGFGFEAIAEAVQRATGSVMTTPANVDYFSVREGDFVVPEFARKILALYGENAEIEGVPQRVLHRFPIELVGDTVEENVDFTFSQFSKAGIQFWSDKADASHHLPEGVEIGDRVCKTLVDLPKGADGKAVRSPAGRDPAVLGKCEPEKCSRYQSGTCSMRGNVYFHIPGIELATPFAMSIGSKNFAIETEGTLEAIRNATGGRLTGFGKPIFFLTKQQREIPMLDDDGKPKRVTHHIVVLEAMVDMPKLRLSNAAYLPIEQKTAVLQKGEQAAALLEAHEPAQAVVPVAQVEAVANAPTPEAPAGSSVARETSTTQAPVEKSGKSLQSDVAEATARAGFTNGERVKAYARAKFGEGWVRDPKALRTLVETLDAVALTRKALLASLEKCGVTLEQFVADDPEPAFWDFSSDEINKRLQAVVE